MAKKRASVYKKRKRVSVSRYYCRGEVHAMRNQKARKRWHVIADLIKDIPEPVGVEVGVLTGRNLFYLLNNVPDLTMVGVDPYVPFDGGDTNSKYSKKILDDMYSSVKQKAEKHNCSILRMSSEVAVDY